MFIILRYILADNSWLDIPSTYQREDLKGAMASIDSKVYVFGKPPSDASKLALHELDTGSFFNSASSLK